jgi:hypothetical protein
MKPWIACLLTLLLLTGCNLPLTPTPAASLGTTEGPASGPDPNHPCAFTWARQPLPELSDQLQQAIRKIQLDASARAEAYGENCVDEQGEVVYFTAMETDLYISFPVTDLQDRPALGELLDQTLTILDEFPADQTPGPQPGYVSLRFETKDDTLNLWFPVTQAKQLRQDGKQGVELLKSLQEK